MTDNTFRFAADPTQLLLFSTIRITAHMPNGSVSYGTGFYYSFCQGSDGTVVPTIVTNKHVLAGATKLTLFFRRAGSDLAKPIVGNSIPVSVEGVETAFFHPDPEIDLCALPLCHLFAQMTANGDTPWIGGLDSSMLPESPGNPPIRAIEEVLMVGYPIGLWDDINDMPIVRRGITATPPLLDWRGKKEFLIDVACFPGSSGSPIFMIQQRMRGAPEPGGSPQHLTFIRLLGVLYAGPQFTANGSVRVVDIPTAQHAISSTNIPANLGIVIKWSAMRDIDNMITEQIKNNECRFLVKPLFIPPDPPQIPKLF
jgi:hypothetical protein